MKLLVKNTHTVFEVLKEILKEGDKVVDATTGNGNDTLNLAQLVGSSGRVYAFDIQEQALQNAKEKLELEGLERRVQWILDSHANLSIYVKQKIKAMIMNLGYLPRGDESIITKSESSIECLREALGLLEENGVISVVGYVEHPGGAEEVREVEGFLAGLDSKVYQVVKISKPNQGKSPISYFIFS